MEPPSRSEIRREREPLAKSNHTPIPRYRTYQGPDFLSQGFRPFFLFASAWAVVALALSVTAMMGRLPLPSPIDPLSWHGHEMIYGYVTAVIAGYLLITIPNWTGRLPLQGRGLLFLVALWLAGRIAAVSVAYIGLRFAAVIDLTFLLALNAVVFREIVHGRNWRNLPYQFILVLLTVGNAFSHAETIGWVDSNGMVQRLTLTVIITLIVFVSGRIIPSFTRNWLARQRLPQRPKSFGRADRTILGLTALTLLLWTLTPDTSIVAALLAIAAALNIFRLARWCGYKTLSEPLLWSLHLGFLWIPLGLLLLALAAQGDSLPLSGAMHALTTGAIGTMTLSVMARSTLSQTGRFPAAGKGLGSAFGLVTLASVTRIAAALSEAHTVLLLEVAAFLWVAAFTLFLILCGPMLLGPRAPRETKHEEPR